jgi:hypothetical protein
MVNQKLLNPMVTEDGSNLLEQSRSGSSIGNQPSKGLGSSSGSSSNQPSKGLGSSSGSSSNQPSKGLGSSSGSSSSNQPSKGLGSSSGNQPSNNPPSATPSARDKYGFPLKYGDKTGHLKNSYVRAIQKRLLPERLWTGNYLHLTKQAIVDFIKEHGHEIPRGITYVKDGSEVSLGLYNFIVLHPSHSDDDEEQSDSSNNNQKSDETKSTTTSQQTASDPNRTQVVYRGSVVIRFPLYIGFGSGSPEAENIVRDIQEVVNSKPTGILDDETILNLRQYVSDAENIRLMNQLMGNKKPTQIDYNLLNREHYPGITEKLFRSVIELANSLDTRVVKEALKRMYKVLSNNKKILSEALSPAYASANQQYQAKLNEFFNLSNNSGVVDYDYNDPDYYIVLTQGKFRQAKVPKQLINDLTMAAKKAGLDPYVLYGMVGQESTFGNGSGDSQSRRGSKATLISGWNLKEAYRPYDINRFLADNRVPGVQQTKSNHGYAFSVIDENKVNQHLNANPKILERYLQKLNSTPTLPANFDDFYQAAVWVKQKGVASYNPGDKGYTAAVNNSIALLKSDKVFTSFLANPVITAKKQFTPGREPRRKRAV